MNRRDFTQKCVAAVTGLLSTQGIIKAVETENAKLKKILKTDTHVHLFDLDNLSYSWLKNAPEINRNFSIQDFLHESKRSAIGKILFMESGADAGLGIKEASWVATLVKQEPRIKGIIAKLDLSQGSGTAKELEQLAELELLKGIRGGFPEDAPQSSPFLKGLKLLAQRNLSFDLLLSAPLLDAAALVAKKCPDNVFILDHIGNPDIKGDNRELWEKGIRQLAQLPNVNCKISGIITRIGKDWTLDRIKPYVNYVIEQFGTDRLVYGGDWPVVLRAGSYRSWSRAFEKLTSDLSQNELHKIYHENADRLYKL